MSEYFQATIDMSDFVNKCAERINRRIDEATLAKVEPQLAEYGYIKVMRCRDCKYYQQDPDPIDPGWPMLCADTGRDMLEPDGFCAWAESKVDE